MNEMLTQIQGFRLSPLQRQLWLLQQQGTQVYYVRCAVALEGILSADILREATLKVVERYEILRTVFQRTPGLRFPAQVIEEQAALDWQEIDLGALEADEQQTRLDELFMEGALPVGLEEGPLFAVRLVELSPVSHVLIASQAAVCADATGLKNVVLEIERSYAACVEGEELPGEPAQYADLAEWQNELFESEETGAGREFWLQQDIASSLHLRLPHERRPSKDSAFQPSRFALGVEPKIADKLVSLAAGRRARLSTVLLAGWQVLLSRLTGQPGVAVGALFDGRNYEELEGALGLFAKYLPVPSRMEDDTPFAELLEQVEWATTNAAKWQESFTREHHGVGEAGEDLAGLPFSFDFNTPDSGRSFCGLTSTVVRLYACIDRFKVRLSAMRSNHALLTEFHYDAACFEPEAVELLARQFHRLLASIAADPATPVGQLDIVTAEERQRLLVGFNDTRAEYARDVAVHRLFERQVSRTPDGMAVREGERQLSYRELNARANQLAHYLRSLGVGPDDLVGIFMERSVEMLVALLGVMKAGGAYLPLDTQYPKQRVAFMLDDARPAALLTRSGLKGELPETAARIVCMDSDWQEVARESEESPPGLVAGDNLVYVIYTSGSTGRPKGVMISHQNLSNYMKWCSETYAAVDGSGAPLHSPLGFDLTVTSIFTPLLTGQTVLLLDESAGVSALGAALRAERNFSFVKITPAHLEVLNQQVPAEEAAGCATAFVIGGEALSGTSLELWRAHAPGTRLINEYGPTETTVGCCVYELKLENDYAGAIPIGRPIFNTQIYLLDGHLKPVPAGVPGELYIAGDGLARGYLNRPDLTAECFIANPFSPESGARMYRSGDLARFTSGGEIEFLGRADHQVKIRGFRIETGEIEAVLAAHPAVRDALVVVREDVAGDKRLVGYFVTDERHSASLERTLREFLRERLPEYMLPAALVALEVFPLTHNGKVNREALPDPEQHRPDAEADSAAPRTPVQEMLGRIWKDVLNVEHVGPSDNFFKLGGHSLLATRVVSRARDIFQVKLELQDLFEEPTLAGLASRMEARQGAASRPRVVPISRAPRGGELPLSFAQQRLWFIDQLEPGSIVYNVPAAFRLAGPLDVSALERTLGEVVGRHEVLRTTFTATDGRPLQVIAPSSELPLPLRDLSVMPENERKAEAHRLAVEEARRPFDLAAGPMLRASLLRLDPREHVLLLTMHHIVSDGWSQSVLVREMATLYEAFSMGQPSPLPELPVQYVDFAVWQREWLQGETLEAQLGYWRQRLLGAPVLELPADRPRPTVRSTSGSAQGFMLPASLGQSLKVLSEQENVTMFMLLLAGFKTLLHRYTGQQDIVVGTDVANRNWAETEALIGFFVNQLVLRTDLSGVPTFRELLGRVRETALGAYTHQDLPFDKLVEALRPDRAASSTPLFQAKLVMQNVPMPELTLSELGLHPFDVAEGPGTAKLDLLLTLMEGEQGIGGTLEYSTDLFDAPTIARVVKDFEGLLNDIVARPDARINTLELLSDTTRARQVSEKKQQRAEAGLKRFTNVKPKAVSVSQKSLVKTGFLGDGQRLPLVVEPGLSFTDLAGWARSNRELVESVLLQHGGILFRGFDIASRERFAEFLEAISLPLMRYSEGATPRTELGNRIYTSTEYPPDQSIALHNELTYVISWPMKIAFCCVQPAEQRGETPIADVRRVLARISTPVRKRFIEKGWRLARNFGEGLSLSWESSFHMTERTEVEAYCRSAQIDFEWKSGDRLRTQHVRPAVARHPRTREEVWFNHVAFWHVSSLEPQVREAMLEMFGEEGLPYNTYYGDGARIEDGVVEEIREAYRAETVVFGWQKGDVILLDNMLVAHGRSPYVGARKILTAMGEAHNEGGSLRRGAEAR
jgi:amino acid adenylation domain-containing protein